MNLMQSTATLRAYRANHDGAAVFDLYRICFQNTWPLSAAVFPLLLSEHADYQAGDHFVAEKDGQIVGFVATQRQRVMNKDNTKGGIALLMVHPNQHRQGIGRRLQEMAVHHLKQIGLDRICLGIGNAHRFWQGVPENLPGATTFFRACGWHEAETSFDLIGDVYQLKTPSDLAQEREIPNLHIRLAEAEETLAILDFEEQEFPHWRSAFQSRLEQGRFEDILIAQNAEGHIVGVLTLTDWQSTQDKTDLLWSALLGEKLGALGVVGVAASAQGQGIGSALVTTGGEILKTRGVDCIHIEWTGRVAFYERLGYTLWQRYHHMNF